MDCQAEQEMEIEALQAILMDDLQELGDERPDGWPSKSYRVAINPNPEGESSQNGQDEYQIELLFAHTPSYPDEEPLYRARSSLGLSDADIASINSILAEQVEANMGMAMIYALVSAAQDWLQEKISKEAGQPTLDPEAARKLEEEAEERRLAELRSHGTMVSPQTFAEWKKRFDAEMALSRAKLTADGIDRRSKGLSGKQFFRQLEADNLQANEDAEEGSDEDADYDEGDDEDDLEGSEEDDDFLDDYLADKDKN